jgi:hypothetical protein
MKTFIQNINKYLVERYPNIWNIKLVWVISVSLLFHIIFFLLGMAGLSNPESLHSYNAEDVFFNSGAIFFNVILSILIAVIWLVYLLKNNAFKAFYPTKRLDLFKQFCCYFIAIFCCSSFYLSYSTGLKTYIKNTYPDQKMVGYITTANDASLFLTHSISNYTIDNKRFPDFYFDNYCETNEDLIDYKKTYYSTFEFDYQFYNVKSEDVLYSQLNRTDSNDKRYNVDDVIEANSYSGFLHKKKKDSLTITYYYKDSVLNARSFLKTLEPSYYNYAETFYTNNDLKNDYSQDVVTKYYSTNKRNQTYKNYTKERYLRSKKNTTLLDRNNPIEIKSVLNNFLEVSKLFKIKNNLNTDKWFDLIYNPTNFEITNIINTQKPRDYNYSSIKELTLSEKFAKKHKTKYYLESEKLKKVFINIDDIKESTPVLEGLHVFAWLAFGCSLLIFMFRVTDLKTLLFSIVTTGIVTLLFTLLMFLIFYVFRANNTEEEYTVSYIGLLVSALILSVPLFFYKNLKKIIVGICLNISLAGFLPFLLLIIVIISIHQDDYYRDIYTKYSEHPDTLIESLGILWSPVFLIIGFIFIYLYSGIIKKWKALPEG